MAVLIILLCVFNLVMWLLAIVRFKKMFSTDEIIEETRTQLDRMLMNINQNAERNITLIEDGIRRLKEAEQEADRHLAVLRGELENVGKSKVFKEKINSLTPSRVSESSVEYPEITSEEEKRPRSRSRSTVSSKSTGTKPAKSVKSKQETQTPVLKVRSPLDSYEKERREQRMIGGRMSLQDEMDLIVERAGQTDFDVETDASPTFSGDFPTITNAAEMVSPKKSINKQVRELAEKGYTIEEIALNLGISTTEVKLGLEF